MCSLQCTPVSARLACGPSRGAREQLVFRKFSSRKQIVTSDFRIAATQLCRERAERACWPVCRSSECPIARHRLPARSELRHARALWRPYEGSRGIVFATMSISDIDAKRNVERGALAASLDVTSWRTAKG